MSALGAFDAFDNEVHLKKVKSVLSAITPVGIGRLSTTRTRMSYEITVSPASLSI